MPTSQLARLLQGRSERMLIARVGIALGLALLLVVGAWSTSHGTAEAHAAVCVATGGTPSTSVVTTGVVTTGAVTADGATATPVAVSPDAAACVFAVLGGFALVLLLARLLRSHRVAFRSLALRAVTIVRAGPDVRMAAALSIHQLSISRT